MVEVVVTSTEIIKPSRPTPHHLRHLQLSFLDLLNRKALVPFIFFYPPPQNLQNISHRLKRSLADALATFYPLAGKVRDHVSVDCNDEGVKYVEARARCPMSGAIARSDLAELNNFLPVSDLEDVEGTTLAVQVTFFECGGLAVGLCLNHKVADGLRLINFVHFWAALARGDHSNLVSPRFDLAVLFPPKDIPASLQPIDEKISAKRFVFNPSAVSALKARYLPDRAGEPIGDEAEEAISAFIWSRFVAAARVTMKNRKRHFLVLHAADLHPLLNPPPSELYFGNVIGFSTMSPNENHDFVAQMREAIKGINGDYVKRLQKANLNLGYSNAGRPDVEVVSFMFVSVRKLPLYEADFGWGRPVWVSMAKQPVINSVVFLPTRSGDGVEVLFFLKEREMVELEADEEFLKLVSPSYGNGTRHQLLSSL